MPRPPVRRYSRLVVDGVERAPSRAMLRAVGFKDADFAKPQVGIASTWSMVTPCNMHIDELAREAARRGRRRRRRRRASSSTRSRSPTASRWARRACATRSCRARSSPTRSRPWSAAEGFDGLVAIGGCDKNMPGCADGASRGSNRPAVFVYGGTIRPGAEGARHRLRVRGRRRHASGAIDDAELAEDRAHARSRAPGSCGGMYTANTMASAIEALGMSLPNSSAQEAVSERQARDCRQRRRGRGRSCSSAASAARHPDARGVRERHHGRHRARRLDQRRAAPARDRACGAGRRSRSTTSRASARACRCSPTSSRAAGT